MLTLLVAVWCVVAGADEPAPLLARAKAATAEASGTIDSVGCVQTVEKLPASPLYDADDRRLQDGTLLVVLKAQRRIEVFSGGKLAKTAEGRPACWWMGLASGYVEGHKLRRGDLRTPEGWYRVSDRPWSKYYSAISIHYPRAADVKRGLAAGLVDATEGAAITSADESGALPPMDTRLGGRIVLHGGGGFQDWTLGCVAMENDQIDALRSLMPKNLRANMLILP